jgi:AraC-like DNA-binding protein
VEEKMSAAQKYSEKYFRFESDINAKPIVGHRHYHDAFEIYYLEDGECRYFIDNKSYDVRAGDVILVPEGVIHHTAYREGVHSRKLLYCSRATIPASVTDRLASLFYLYRNESISPQIKEIFEEIERESALADPFSLDVISARVELLFLLMARNKNTCPDTSEGNGYVTAAVEYVRRNFGSEVKLCDAAREISVSPEHLSRVFKKETGFGFCEYLTLIRLKNAEELLLNRPDMSVSDVAYACGFNDSNYFCERFKKSYGAPPLKYRKGLEKA